MHERRIEINFYCQATKAMWRWEEERKCWDGEEEENAIIGYEGRSWAGERREKKDS